MPSTARDCYPDNVKDYVYLLNYQEFITIITVCSLGCLLKEEGFVY